jgi:hypothetical protein
MKKIYTLLAGVTIAGSVVAQQANFATPVPATGSFIMNQVQAAVLKKTFETHAAQYANPVVTGASIFERLSPAFSVYNNLAGANISFYANPVFVDSTVTVNYSTPAPISSEKIGGIFDPTSPNYPMSQRINRFQPYNLDTVWIAGNYNIQNTTVGDTLQVEISWGVKSDPWYLSLQTNATPHRHWITPVNIPSMAVGNTCADKATTGTNHAKWIHIFTITDSVTIGNPNAGYIAVTGPSIAIPAGDHIGVQYTYINKKPHYFNQNYFNASPSDTSKMNSFIGTQLAQTDLNSTGSNNAHYWYDSTSNQMTGTLLTKSRYGQYTGAQAFLNGYMSNYDGYAYLWDVSIHYTATGINELTKLGVAMTQNMPNPFNGNTEIGYELVNNSDVLFTVYDMSGKAVIENNLGHVSAGKHTITMNGANLSKGVYFYNIKANGASLTKKMVITE